MQIASIRSLHMSPDGILTLVSDGGAKVRQITPDGMLHTIVGNGNGGALPTDGTLAASTPTYNVPDAVQAADGTIYVPSRSPYDDHGALSGIQLRVQGRITWSQQLTRDSIGRITVQRDSDATTGDVHV